MSNALEYARKEVKRELMDNITNINIRNDFLIGDITLPPKVYIDLFLDGHVKFIPFDDSGLKKPTFLNYEIKILEEPKYKLTVKALEKAELRSVVDSKGYKILGVSFYDIEIVDGCCDDYLKQLNK